MNYLEYKSCGTLQSVVCTSSIYELVFLRTLQNVHLLTVVLWFVADLFADNTTT